MSKKFSFIIPTIRATNLIADCVGSFRNKDPHHDECEIIVVDDGSDQYVQGWLKKYAEEHNIKLFLSPTNKGFSHSVNLGMKHAEGKYLVLVNNDIIFTKPVLRNLEQSFAVDEKVGLVGAKLLYPDGTIQHAGVVRPPRQIGFVHINKHQAGTFPASNQSKFFIAVTGAFFAIRREMYEDIGGLNENYFIACEDVEYCLRAWNRGWKVFYDHTVEAIHVEGFTRGNTDASKLKKGAEWYIKEKETIGKFHADLKQYNLEGLDASVALANKTKSTQNSNQPQAVIQSRDLIKLEIGCGFNPQKGYIHLDARPLPDVEHVANFETDKLPFADNALDEILSNHSIEHISWRSLPFVFGEWFRTLRPGGKVFLRTPDLEFICKTYLANKTTPEWPGDEDFIKKNLSSEISPSWWANLKLFAGQDYPENLHKLCFDFNMIKALFERHGFTNVQRVSVQPVFSPGELQVEAYKKQAYVSHTETHQTKILVKRRGALGDVVLTTPIIAQLREDNGPDAIIHMATDCPVAFHNNPKCSVVPYSTPSKDYDSVYDLDLCYERNPAQHIVESYAKAVFGNSDFDKKIEIYSTDQDNKFVSELMASMGIELSKTVVVHMAVTWRNRTWPKEKWEVALKQLASQGLHVVVIGSGGDYKLSGDGIFDLTGKLTIQKIAALISSAKCFVGNDSGLLHVAGSTDVPIVGLFTSARGEYRVPYRNGEYGYNCTILRPSIDCYGCLAREMPPVVYCDCRRGDFICLTQITPDDVVKAVSEIVGG